MSALEAQTTNIHRMGGDTFRVYFLRKTNHFPVRGCFVHLSFLFWSDLIWAGPGLASYVQMRRTIPCYEEHGVFHQCDNMSGFFDKKLPFSSRIYSWKRPRTAGGLSWAEFPVVGLSTVWPLDITTC